MSNLKSKREIMHDNPVSTYTCNNENRSRIRKNNPLQFFIN